MSTLANNIPSIIFTLGKYEKNFEKIKKEIEELYGKNSVEISKFVHENILKELSSFTVEELESNFGKYLTIYSYYSGVINGFIINKCKNYKEYAEKIRKTTVIISKFFEDFKEVIEENCLRFGINYEDFRYCINVLVNSLIWISKIEENEISAILENSREYIGFSINLRSLEYSLVTLITLMNSEQASSDAIRWVFRRCMDYAENTESYLDTLDILIHEMGIVKEQT